jgi:endonuclease/exonuclease/phosphatase (EEP) superfamily protein YafD
MRGSFPWASVRWLTLAALYAGAVGLAAGTILAEFGDDWWIADLFAHFRFQYAIAALAIAAFALLLRHRRLALVAVALVVPQALAIASVPIAARAPAAAPEQRIRVVTSNIQGRVYNFDPLIAQFRAARPDVIVLQEVLPGAAPLIEKLRKDNPHVAPADWRTRSYTVILSRHPIEAQHYSYEPYSPVVEAHLRHPAGAFRVIAVHAPYPMNGVLYHFHGRYFAGWLAAAARAQTPTIVAGDFNLTPWSTRFRAAWRLSGLSFAGDYHAWPRTWPAHALPRQYLPAYLIGGIPIDHVLVSRHFAVSRILRGPYVGSDHYPVMVDLLLRP